MGVETQAGRELALRAERVAGGPTPHDDRFGVRHLVGSRRQRGRLNREWLIDRRHGGRAARALWGGRPRVALRSCIDRPVGRGGMHQRHRLHHVRVRDIGGRHQAEVVVLAVEAAALGLVHVFEPVIPDQPGRRLHHGADVAGVRRGPGRLVRIGGENGGHRVRCRRGGGPERVLGDEERFVDQRLEVGEVRLDGQVVPDLDRYGCIAGLQRIVVDAEDVDVLAGDLEQLGWDVVRLRLDAEVQVIGVVGVQRGGGHREVAGGEGGGEAAGVADVLLGFHEPRGSGRELQVLVQERLVVVLVGAPGQFTVGVVPDEIGVVGERCDLRGRHLIGVGDERRREPVVPARHRELHRVGHQRREGRRVRVVAHGVEAPRAQLRHGGRGPSGRARVLPGDGLAVRALTSGDVDVGAGRHVVDAGRIEGLPRGVDEPPAPVRGLGHVEVAGGGEGPRDRRGRASCRPRRASVDRADAPEHCRHRHDGHDQPADPRPHTPTHLRHRQSPGLRPLGGRT